MSEDRNKSADRRESLRTEAADRFLSKLLEHLALEDPTAHRALLAANPALSDLDGDLSDVRRRARTVLTGEVGGPLSPGRRQLIDEIEFALNDRRNRQPEWAVPFVAPDELPGFLTSLTRKLSVEKAQGLYRKLTPIFVYEMLKRLNESPDLQLVHELVDHLCSDEVQSRLRQCAHVRDAILDECCGVLGRTDVQPMISRDYLYKIFEQSGAITELTAMENCIKLVAAQAG